MISNLTPKFSSQIRSIRSVFGRNRTGIGSEKIDRIDRNRNRISGRTLPVYVSDLQSNRGFLFGGQGMGLSYEFRRNFVKVYMVRYNFETISWI